MKVYKKGFVLGAFIILIGTILLVLFASYKSKNKEPEYIPPKYICFVDLGDKVFQIPFREYPDKLCEEPIKCDCKEVIT